MDKQTAQKKSRKQKDIFQIQTGNKNKRDPYRADEKTEDRETDKMTPR